MDGYWLKTHKVTIAATFTLKVTVSFKLKKIACLAQLSW